LRGGVVTRHRRQNHWGRKTWKIKGIGEQTGQSGKDQGKADQGTEVGVCEIHRVQGVFFLVTEKKKVEKVHTQTTPIC